MQKAKVERAETSWREAREKKRYKRNHVKVFFEKIYSALPQVLFKRVKKTELFPDSLKYVKTHLQYIIYKLITVRRALFIQFQALEKGVGFPYCVCVGAWDTCWRTVRRGYRPVIPFLEQ